MQRRNQTKSAKSASGLAGWDRAVLNLPRCMYLLKKLFQLRDHVNPDHEKPFLEHLEDLRTMITKIVVTLVISMLVCFTFQEKLMEVLRRPVDKVWEAQMIAKLPQASDGAAHPLDVTQWERAKAVEHAVLGLDATQR